MMVDYGTNYFESGAGGGKSAGGDGTHGTIHLVKVLLGIMVLNTQ